MMLGGLSQQGRELYETFVEAAKEHLFYRPMTLNEEDILISGTLMKAMGHDGHLETEAQHLTCFIGGLLAIAGKIFQRDEDLKDGSKLAAGCVWGYKSTMTGIMPETFTTLACTNRTDCPWDEKTWWQATAPARSDQEARNKINQERLPPGFTGIQDRRFLLR
jgi:mannosyl-oligosaccharide alpha-1,2-mannosidase